MNKEQCQCKLCGQFFAPDDMSDEHYPARSVGNDDFCFNMTNIFDIKKKNYTIVEGVDDPSGGYHGQILLGRLFSSMTENDIDS